MTVAELHPAVREALAAYEMLRRLNFTPDEIFMNPSDRDHKLYAIIRVAGKDDAAIGIYSPLDLDFEMFHLKWAEAATWWNSRTDPQPWVTETAVWQDSARLVAVLTAAGYDLTGRR